jgi:hypothetical protein
VGRFGDQIINKRPISIRKGDITMDAFLTFRRIEDAELENGLKQAESDRKKATKFWQPLTQYPINFINAGNYSKAREYLYLT